MRKHCCTFHSLPLCFKLHSASFELLLLSLPSCTATFAQSKIHTRLLVSSLLLSSLDDILMHRFVYEEEQGAESFFVPYIWKLVLQMTRALRWDTRNAELIDL